MLWGFLLLGFIRRSAIHSGLRGSIKHWYLRMPGMLGRRRDLSFGGSVPADSFFDIHKLHLGGWAIFNTRSDQPQTFSKGTTMMTTLKTICSYRKEKIDPQSLQSNSYVSTDGMASNKKGIFRFSIPPAHGKVTRYLKDDILVSNIRPYFKKIWLADRDGRCSTTSLVLRQTNIAQASIYTGYYAMINFSIMLPQQQKGRRCLAVTRMHC